MEERVAYTCGGWLCEELVKASQMCVSHLVMSDSLQPQGLQLARLRCPLNSSGKNTGVGLPFPSPGGSVVKNLPTMQETQVRYLGQDRKIP